MIGKQVAVTMVFGIFALLNLVSPVSVAIGSPTSNGLPPAPFGSIPSPQQLAWQKKEMIAFTHFNMNTFTGNEWGQGSEDPKLFNPTGIDCKQWVTVLKGAGFKEIILTAKHHDGFCLWPSAYTDHSVKSSNWENGHGDVVKLFTDACKAQHVTCGIYLSPWDRNSPYYGDSPTYNQYYVNQLTELLTHYGNITEVWFDGANAEGPNGKKQVYDWDAFYNTVAKFAPDAVIFNGSSTSGRGVQWTGNEAGYAADTNWNHAGNVPDAPGWFPIECDVSIRPGWYYHPSEDTKLKSGNDLLDIYYHSVGHGAVLLLNVPPDQRGLIADSDVARLSDLRKALTAIFSNDLAAGKPVSATNTRGQYRRFSPSNLTSRDYDSYWATDDGVHQASASVDLGKPTAFNNIVLQEYIPLGQRISSFTIDAFNDDAWSRVGAGTTIGYKRIVWIPRTIASKVRVTVASNLACPVLTKIGIYNGPFDAKYEPVSLIAQKPATASDVHGNQTEYGADKAVDGDSQTRWATNDGTSECWLEADAGAPVTFSSIRICEFAPRIQKFQIEYRESESDAWQVAMIGAQAGLDYNAEFPVVTGRFIRLHILSATEAPTIYEFQVFAPLPAH